MIDSGLPPALAIAAIGLIAGVVTQVVVAWLTGYRDYRMFNRQTALQAATEFLAACDAVWRWSYTVGQDHGAADDAIRQHEDPGAAKRLLVELEASRQQRAAATDRATTALAPVRLWFPHLADMADEFLYHCLGAAYLDRGDASHALSVQRTLRKELEVRLSAALGIRPPRDSRPAQPTAGPAW